MYKRNKNKQTVQCGMCKMVGRKLDTNLFYNTLPNNTLQLVCRGYNGSFFREDTGKAILS